jgi:abequosyltransferase
MQKLISFCIPTLGNDKYISQTLESILHQSKIDDIEIIIGDSSKDDKTQKIVNNFKLKFPNIFYIKFYKSKGFDFDFEKTISYSTAKYCWFLSSDDVLMPGAINFIKKELIRNKEVYLFNRIICNLDLKITNKSNRWLISKKSKNFYLSNEKNFLKYINLGTSIGCLFSYMSSIIVKKKAWDDVPNYSNFFKRGLFPVAYMHSLKILCILLKKNFSLRYLSKDLVYFRGDNDSFKKKGYFNRINIDFDGYRLISEFFFKNESLKSALKGLMRREHKFYYLLRYRNECSSIEHLRIQMKNLKYYGYLRWQIFFINFFGKSKLILMLLRSLKRFFL